MVHSRGWMGGAWAGGSAPCVHALLQHALELCGQCTCFSHHQHSKLLPSCRTAAGGGCVVHGTGLAVLCCAHLLLRICTS